VSFTWQAFADLAVWLLEERTDEASQRMAISRAYYAAYHAASVHVRANQLYPPEQHMTHCRVWKLLRDAKCPRCTEIASLGFAVETARVKADYRNPFPGDLASAAMDAITTSTAIIALLRESQPTAET